MNRAIQIPHPIRKEKQHSRNQYQISIIGQILEIQLIHQ